MNSSGKNERNAEPYKPPTRVSRLSGVAPPSDGGVIRASVAFSIPAVVLVVLSFVGVGFFAKSALVKFFLFGGHAILLVALLVAAVMLTRKSAHDGRANATVMLAILAPIYIAASLISWLVVAAIVWISAMIRP